MHVSNARGRLREPLRAARVCLAPIRDWRSTHRPSHQPPSNRALPGPGRPQTADAYRQAIEVSPRDYRAWYGLGQTYELLQMPYYALYYYR